MDPAKEDPLDQPGLNTWLASILQRRGRVDPATVSRLLATALQPTGGKPRTLARALLDEGLVPPNELGGCLREAQALAADTPTIGPRAVPVSWGPGVQVGDLTIVRALGAGGMGEVYLAEGPEGQVALKSLPTGASVHDRQRFKREGKAASGPSPHPNVLRVHRHGVAPGGRPYLVMDFASGGDLREMLLAGPLPPARAATVVRDLALGLAHMHTHGVLHRDLKPANVLFDAGGTPKLVDFGLAKIEGGTTLTRTGMIMGTPAYMPPEQAEGIADKIDARSDVYGLGAVLFQCLTGEPPFPGQTLVQILTKVLHNEPRPPSSLNPQVPPALDRVCLKAIQREREDRYASAEAFAEALDAALRGEDPPALASAPTSGTRSLWVGVAVAVGAIALGLGVRSLRQRRTVTPTASPAAPLPTPTSGPAVAPQPGGISWRLTPGETMRLEAKIVTTNRIQILLQKNQAQTTSTQRFRLETLSTDGVRARLKLTFEHLEIQLVDPVNPARNELFDSSDPKHRAHDLQRTIGRGFELVIDQDTGRVYDVVGAEELYDHVHPQGTSPQSGPLTLRAFRSAPSTRELFNRMLFCFPADAKAPEPATQRTWRRTERLEPRGDVQEALLSVVNLLRGRRGPRFDPKSLLLTSEYRVEPRPDEGWRIRWTGARDIRLGLRALQRKTRGTVEWRAGRLRTGEVQEELRHPRFGWTRTVVRVEISPLD